MNNPNLPQLAREIERVLWLEDNGKHRSQRISRILSALEQALELGRRDEFQRCRADIEAAERETQQPRDEPWTVDKENKELIAPTGERFSVGFASMDSERLAELINATLAAPTEDEFSAIRAEGYKQGYQQGLRDAPTGTQARQVEEAQRIIAENAAPTQDTKRLEYWYREILKHENWQVLIEHWRAEIDAAMKEGK